MKNRITWTDGQYSSITGRLKTRRLGSISYTTSRAAKDDEKYDLRMRLIGGDHDSKHPDPETAKAHAEKVLLRQMELIGFVPVDEPAHCPYDCDSCHDKDTCPCKNCKSWRED